MTCEALFNRMGFACDQRSEGLYFVETPLSFPDGEPISLYFSEEGNSVVVSDNANTLFHLRSIGMNVSDRKKWRGVRQIVNTFGLALSEGGEVYCDSLPNRAHNLVSRYLGAMLAISDMEREYTGLTEEMAQYLEEVETNLRKWKSQAELSYSPSITGHSGRVHQFHFQFDGDLIDAAKPNSIRTGSILRKAADIQNSEKPRKIMVIMDDRQDPERAAAETDILSTLVSVLAFTNLARNASMSVRQ